MGQEGQVSESPRSAGSAFPLEMLGYVGLAGVVLGYFILVGGQQDLFAVGSMSITLLIGLLGILLLGAGWAVKGSDEPVPRRLCDVLWLLSVMFVASAIGSIMNNAFESAEHLPQILGSLAGAIYAAILWAMRKHTLMQLALFLAVLGSVAALADALPFGKETGEFGFEVAVFPTSMLAVWILGVVWMMLGRSGTITPKRPALVLGAIAMLVAPLAFDSLRWTGIILGILSVIVVFYLAAAEDHAGLVGLGIVGAFVYIADLVFEHLSQLMDSPTTIGIIVLALGVVLMGYVLMTLKKGMMPAAGAPPAPPAMPAEPPAMPAPPAPPASM